MNKPCATRDKILQFIILYREEWGFGPSIREIARAVGVTSPTTVAQHLDQLELRGLITREEHKWRSIAATESVLPIPSMI